MLVVLQGTGCVFFCVNLSSINPHYSLEECTFLQIVWPGLCYKRGKLCKSLSDSTGPHRRSSRTGRLFVKTGLSLLSWLNSWDYTTVMDSLSLTMCVEIQSRGLLEQHCPSFVGHRLLLSVSVYVCPLHMLNIWKISKPNNFICGEDLWPMGGTIRFVLKTRGPGILISAYSLAR